MAAFEVNVPLIIGRGAECRMLAGLSPPARLLAPVSAVSLTEVKPLKNKEAQHVVERVHIPA